MAKELKCERRLTRDEMSLLRRQIRHKTGHVVWYAVIAEHRLIRTLPFSNINLVDEKRSDTKNLNKLTCL